MLAKGLTHHTPNVRLDPRQPPPEHYYADNLLTLVRTVLDRYGDILTAEEREFGELVNDLTTPGQRLLARLVGRVSGRPDAVIRDDSLDYAEVDGVPEALAELAESGLVERCPPVSPETLLGRLTRTELSEVFWEYPGRRQATKADQVERILARNPPCFCRWRVRRFVGWVGLIQREVLDLYRLLFFGDRHQDLTTFVLRDLGVHRYEPVDLSRRSRQFPDRATLTRYLEIAAAEEASRALFSARSTEVDDDGLEPDARREAVAALVDHLWAPLGNRMLERRRSRALNRLGRNLEREGDFDTALACYARSGLAPARERRMRMLHRLGDRAGVENLRAAIVESPWSTLEADFAARFRTRFRRRPAPVVDQVLTTPAERIEAHALDQLTAHGGVGWHLENHLPMGLFALAYWSWLFAPIEGAFVNAFQTGPVDLYWPDFFSSREAICVDPLDGPLKTRLRERACAKAGVANRLFSWQRLPPTVADTVIEAIPESDLRALLEIVREDLGGRHSGFPDLTVVYGPGHYEFVEVKGPGDQLQIHQRLWIEALERRRLPVRVLRYRCA